MILLIINRKQNRKKIQHYVILPISYFPKARLISTTQMHRPWKDTATAEGHGSALGVARVGGVPDSMLMLPDDTFPMRKPKS